MSIVLKKEELIEIDHMMCQKQLIEKENENINLRKNLEVLNLKIRQLEMNNRIASMEDEIRNNNNKINNIKEKQREFNKSITKKYKIKGNWGINPDSGEIVQEE